MAFTPEQASQVSAMIAEAVARASAEAMTNCSVTIAEAVARASAESAANRMSGDRLRRAFEKMEKFEGGPRTENWKEWYYQFVVAAGAVDEKYSQFLEWVEKVDDVDSTDDLELVLSKDDSKLMHKTMKEIFNLLVQLTSGEANLLVRKVQDKNGYVAWKFLFDRYNAKTPASLTASWREVIRPKKIKDMREAIRAIDAWESKIAMLKKEHDEEPTVGLKAS